jgi:hypothetical protein
VDRRPAIPVAVDVDPSRVRIDSRTGEKYQEIEHTYTEYDVGRIRAGYCCLNCGEAQDEPFPKKCRISFCAYPMRERQAQDFAEQFEGYTTVGPSRSLEELRAEDEEAKARAAYKKAKPTSSIWVPS